jgi:hypothetical protein
MKNIDIQVTDLSVSTLGNIKILGSDKTLNRFGILKFFLKLCRRLGSFIFEIMFAIG